MRGCAWRQGCAGEGGGLVKVGSALVRPVVGGDRRGGRQNPWWFEEEGEATMGYGSRRLHEEDDYALGVGPGGTHAGSHSRVHEGGKEMVSSAGCLQGARR